MRAGGVLAMAAAALAAVGVGAPAQNSLTPKRSGYQDAGPQTRAMQDDDGTNPAFLWVQRGETLWGEKAGRADRSCADCHGDAATSMRGVAARMPDWDAVAGRLLNLDQRIDRCRTDRQEASPQPPPSDQRRGVAP